MIKSMDLVKVVRPELCCGYRNGMNETYYVSRLAVANSTYRCTNCGKHADFIAAECVGKNSGYDIRRLEKIDPPPLLESERDEILEQH